jgi:hypothetical protein
MIQAIFAVDVRVVQEQMQRQHGQQVQHPTQGNFPWGKNNSGY